MEKPTMETQFIIVILVTATAGTLGGFILARLFDLYDDPRETRRRQRRKERKERRRRMASYPSPRRG